MEYICSLAWLEWQQFPVFEERTPESDRLCGEIERTWKKKRRGWTARHVFIQPGNLLKQC